MGGTEAWRTIDVDQYDKDAYTEDKILDEFMSDQSREDILSAAQARSTDVRKLLTGAESKENMKKALSRALEDPPFGRDVDAAKLESTTTVVDLLSKIRSADIEDMLTSLSVEQWDVLMKYIYAGMAKPEQFNSSTLLTWHENLTTVAGTGCIVRVMTDKRTLF